MKWIPLWNLTRLDGNLVFVWVWDCDAKRQVSVNFFKVECSWCKMNVNEKSTYPSPPTNPACGFFFFLNLWGILQINWIYIAREYCLHIYATHKQCLIHLTGNWKLWILPKTTLLILVQFNDALFLIQILCLALWICEKEEESCKWTMWQGKAEWFISGYWRIIPEAQKIWQIH